MKKVLLLFAVLMASVNLACIKQATGIIKCSNGNVIPLAAIRMKGANTCTTASPGGMFQLIVLSGIQLTSDRC